MDLVSENNAFPLDAGAIQVGNERMIVLLPIALNSPIDISQYNTYKELLQRLDSIHCKAFGSGTGIQVVKNEDETFFSLIFNFHPTSHLTILVSMLGNEVQDIIFMAILTEHHDVQEGGAYGGQVDDYITIWSVAKNPAVDFPNAFGVYLENLKIINDFSGYQKFKLQVDPSNTLRMTEQGRIRLYTSLGFNIDTGTLVETIYPEGNFYFRRHEEGNVGRLYLMTSADVDEKCDFIGNLKSYKRNPLSMTATREALGVYRDIYCGYKESFKGNKIMVLDDDRNVVESDPPFPVRKNSNVDISSLLQSIVPSSTESTTTTTSSASASASASAISYFTVLKMSYHMNLIKKFVNNINYIDFCEVPDDFIVISLTSPGSVLRQYDPMIFDNYMLKILPYIRDKVMFKHLLQTHCSTATLPLYNIQDHDDLFANATKAPTANDPNLSNRQLLRSMLNSIIMDSMGRQPIFEIPVEKNSQVPLPGTSNLFKKEQYDIQIYTPGMRMFDYIVSRESEKSAYGSVPINEEGAKLDDEGLSGTFKVTKDKNNKFSIATQINDLPFVNKSDKKFSDYFEYIRATVPKKQGRKYVLFSFGCAPLMIQGVGLPPYELLYELSHRRSIVHTFPPGTRVDSNEFVQTAVLNKHILTEHDCSRFDPVEAARRRNLQESSNSVAVAMNTGSSTTTTSSSSGTLGAGSGSSYQQGGGKQKKRFAKTKRASSRKMATRFRRLRTRKLRKTKGLKTRKMKKGGYTF